MSRFLDQIRKAKEARQRAERKAALRRRRMHETSVSPATPLVPEQPDAESRSLPPSVQSDHLFPVELEERGWHEEPQPEIKRENPRVASDGRTPPEAPTTEMQLESPIPMDETPIEDTVEAGMWPEEMSEPESSSDDWELLAEEIRLDPREGAPEHRPEPEEESEFEPTAEAWELFWEEKGSDALETPAELEKKTIEEESEPKQTLDDWGLLAEEKRPDAREAAPEHRPEPEEESEFEPTAEAWELLSDEKRLDAFETPPESEMEPQEEAKPETPESWELVEDIEPRGYADEKVEPVDAQGEALDSWEILALSQTADPEQPPSEEEPDAETPDAEANGWNLFAEEEVSAREPIPSEPTAYREDPTPSRDAEPASRLEAPEPFAPSALDLLAQDRASAGPEPWPSEPTPEAPAGIWESLADSGLGQEPQSAAYEPLEEPRLSQEDAEWGAAIEATVEETARKERESAARQSDAGETLFEPPDLPFADEELTEPDDEFASIEALDELELGGSDDSFAATPNAEILAELEAAAEAVLSAHDKEDTERPFEKADSTALEQLADIVSEAPSHQEIEIAALEDSLPAEELLAIRPEAPREPTSDLERIAEQMDADEAEAFGETELEAFEELELESDLDLLAAQMDRAAAEARDAGEPDLDMEVEESPYEPFFERHIQELTEAIAPDDRLEATREEEPEQTAFEEPLADRLVDEDAPYDETPRFEFPETEEPPDLPATHWPLGVQDAEPEIFYAKTQAANGDLFPQELANRKPQPRPADEPAGPQAARRTPSAQPRVAEPPALHAAMEEAASEYLDADMDDETETTVAGFASTGDLDDEEDPDSRRRSRRRRRGRGEIPVPGPQADRDFVERLGKLQLRPDKRVLAFYDPQDHVCEEYRLLGKNLLHTLATTPGSREMGKVVTLTSSGRGEGKTLTSVNLAMTLAQDLSDRVVLLDGDLRHPRVHRYLGVPSGSGLNDMLLSDDPASILEDCVQRTDTGLHLLMSSSFGHNPAPILDSENMTRILNQLRSRYSLVIVDTPPVLLATDALTLGVRSDGMLLLLRARKTQREQLQEARQRIARLDIRLLGYVINNVRSFLPQIWRKYYYGNY